MNTIKLNTIGSPCKAGGNAGGGNGGGGSASKWTGHADAEGLKAIGWTDEDIAYYQEHGVNWNAEDDEYHKVSDDNKALYGVLTADNIKTYKDRIVYLPKIDTSAKTKTSNLFEGLTNMVAIPLIDTSNSTGMSYMFNACYQLVTIPLLDTSKVTSWTSMFANCQSLVFVPDLNFSSTKDIISCFQSCRSLTRAPSLLINLETFYSGFYECSSLISIPPYDIKNTTNISNAFVGCYLLRDFKFKNCAVSISFKDSRLLSKASLLYLINNEAATSAITITLASTAYNRLSNDADIVAALANHPNISLTSA